MQARTNQALCSNKTDPGGTNQVLYSNETDAGKNQVIWTSLPFSVGPSFSLDINITSLCGQKEPSEPSQSDLLPNSRITKEATFICKIRFGIILS